MKRIDATLTIYVQYEVPNHHLLANTHMEVTELLATLVDHVVGNGLLTGDSELEVLSWERTIDISPPPAKLKEQESGE